METRKKQGFGALLFERIKTFVVARVKTSCISHSESCDRDWCFKK